MLTDFGRARRKYLAEATRAGHEMGNDNTPWARQPWDKDESGVHHARCAYCDYEVQMYESHGGQYEKPGIYTYHFKRIDAGTQLEVESMPVKCEGRN
jgi:hypothetical protein